MASSSPCDEVLKIYAMIWNAKFSGCEERIKTHPLYENFEKRMKEKKGGGEEIEGEAIGGMFLGMMNGEASLWRCGFTDDEAVHDETIERAKKLQSMCKLILEDGKGNTFLTKLAAGVLISEGYMQRVYCHFRKEEFVTGGLVLRSSWKQIQQNQKDFEDYVVKNTHIEENKYKKKGNNPLPLRPDGQEFDDSDIGWQTPEEPASSSFFSFPSSSSSSSVSSTSSPARPPSTPSPARSPSRSSSSTAVDGISCADMYTMIKRIDWKSLPPLFQLVFGQHMFVYALYLIGFETLPPSFRWLAKTLGFSSGWTGFGMHYAKMAGEMLSCKQYWAILGSTLFEGYYRDELEGCAHCLEDARKSHFQESAILTMTSGYIHRLMGQVKESNADFESSRVFAGDIPQWALTIRYELGYNAYVVGDWEKCIEGVGVYMEKSEMKAYKAFGYYMLGVSYKMLGRDEEEVVKAMKSVAPYARDNQSYDKYGLRKAKQYLKSKKGFHPFELHWIPAYNLLESQEYDRCDGYLDKCRDVLNEAKYYSSRQLRTDHEACYYYVRGTSSFKRKDFESAKKNLQKCISMKSQVKDEIFVVAFALIVYAETCLALLPGDGLLQEATKSIERAKGMSDYDFDNIVSHRIRRSEHTLTVKKAKFN